MSKSNHFPAHSIYLHIPFCRKRCSYCDFNTYAGIESLIPAYVNALCREIVKMASANSTRFPVHTIFFGGGTPSLLSPQQLESILQTLYNQFDVAENAEISMEANPGTIVDDRLKDYHALGVNRLSFGMQSARTDELALLTRIHSHQETINSIRTAREAGFDNLNLDLIYNLPGQKLEHWMQSLKTAVALEPEHLSLYSLTIEHGTLLHRQIKQGTYPHPEDDTAADLMQETITLMEKAGYTHYEISNWSKADQSRSFQCRHNLQYWKNQPYFGFGAGAHGLVNDTRTINEFLPKEYIEKCAANTVEQFPLGPAVVESHLRSRNEQIEDHMILNLRLLEEGINRQEFQDRFNVDLLDLYPKVIPQLVQSGHLEWLNNESNLRIAPQHFFIANQILVRFLLDD